MLRRILAAAALAGCMASGAYAQTGVTLPTIGVEPTDYVTAAGTEIGTALGAVFGLFVVVMVIFGAMRWLKRVRSA